MLGGRDGRPRNSVSTASHAAVANTEGVEEEEEEEEKEVRTRIRMQKHYGHTRLGKEEPSKLRLRWLCDDMWPDHVREKQRKEQRHVANRSGGRALLRRKPFSNQRINTK
jgi:hypothetical protein